MPLDAEPVSGGNVFVGEDGLAHVLKKGEAPVGRRYVSHFVTCPHAKKWRTR